MPRKQTVKNQKKEKEQLPVENHQETSEKWYVTEKDLSSIGSVTVDHNLFPDGVAIEVLVPGTNKPLTLFVNYQTSEMLLVAPREISLIYKTR